MSSPTRFTAPLEADDLGLPLYSDGYRLIELVEKYWVNAGKPLVLDDWQRHLLIRILERYGPSHEKAGRLRYSRVVVSIPRQNGKSLLAAILSLYGLLQHCHSPRVLGLARGREQAEIVYGYTADAIRVSDALRGILRPTGTRGISKVDGSGTYKVLPAKVDAVQGYLSTLAICDELHVMHPDIWNASVTSQKAQTDPLLIGITTAGDINSVLLKRLYKQGDAAINGADDSFGFFCWEAPTGELTIENITAANPAVACGRIDAHRVLKDEIASPPANWTRFTLNRFVEGLAEPWVPAPAWAKCAGTGISEFSDVVWSIDVAKNHTAAIIVASRKRDDGIIETEPMVQMIHPTPEKLLALVKQLKALGPCTFVLNSAANRTLSDAMAGKYKVLRISMGGTNAEATSLAYSLIMQQKVEHANVALVNQQFGIARLKTTGNSASIVSSGGDIDAVYATVYGIYAAETNQKKGIALSA